MILYFSGTGNSEYVAKRIGQEIQDEVMDLFDKIRRKEYSGLVSDKPWVIVSPTYGWRIPRILQEWLLHTHFGGNQMVYFVMTCGGANGNAGKYLEKLCETKGLHYMGCSSIVMPENYIALFKTPDKEEALATVNQAEQRIIDIIEYIRRDSTFPEPKVTVQDKLNSGLINSLFYPLLVHSKKFYVTEACISCGKCETVCPLENIRIENGKPIWGKDCTHCMACICHCPSGAIEYGKHSIGMPRYICPKKL